ncbi:M50 family metallopeptidase [Streptomyces sp. JJ38]|uniref:M50 family metallopeptidase n=1 Tax=Streptomyces sp. JJ38 TaxID=2738128 RepID=UPI001C59C2D1|nr:M50 family metallopeptidase [Streptomyces sp. JJ38]MBW1597112.1 M50 family metallopeptidase [Streptomyces sp. JJ38]
MGIDDFADVWGRVTGVQSAPALWLVVATGLLALAVVGIRAPWRFARNAVTIAHEGGHALMALLTGRQLQGIRLHSDTSGLTVSRGKPTGIGMVLTAAAGYTAPPLLGLGGAALLASGRITALLWGATALLLALLVMVRNAYGVLTVVSAGSLFVLVSWLTSAEVQALFAYAAVWFLLLGGVRPVFELQRERRRARRVPQAAYGWPQGAPEGSSGMPDSDADQLHRLTNVPAVGWLLFFHAVALCSLVGGGTWLLGG